MNLNDLGKIVEDEWLKTSSIRKNVLLNEYVVMPNHFHGILVITEDIDNVGATRRVAPTGKTIKPNTVGSIMGQFKSIVTKRIRKNGYANFKWQRNFYERVIRNEKELESIQEYIYYNPVKWAWDEENPENQK